jgi:hypothetical protein
LTGNPRLRAARASTRTITKYGLPGEMTRSGEVRNGFAHVVMGVEGDRAIAGYLHEAVIGTHFFPRLRRPHHDPLI